MTRSKKGLDGVASKVSKVSAVGGDEQSSATVAMLMTAYGVGVTRSLSTALSAAEGAATKVSMVVWPLQLYTTTATTRKVLLELGCE